MLDALDGVLDKFRPGFTADGFEVGVEPGADGIVVLRVVHKPDACEECLVPDDMMASMFTTAFREVSADVAGVRIEHVRPGE